MAAKQVTQLVKMADQIALNLGAGHDPVPGTGLYVADWDILSLK